MTRTVQSWWKYNPILQKPTSLEPIRPWSWFWYYGPDPAAGVSYGMYRDNDHGFNVVTEADSVVYSPATGKPMEFVDEVPSDELVDLMKRTTSCTKMSRASCSGCRIRLTSDFDLSRLDEFHCTKCGEKASAETGDDTSEEKTMKSKKEKKEKIQAIKRKIRASILRKRRAEAMKQKKEDLDEKRKAAAAARRRDENDEMISLDTIIQAMNEIEEEEQLEEEEAMMEEDQFEEEAMMEEDDEELEEEALMEELDEEEDAEAKCKAEAEEEFEEEEIEEEAMMEEEDEEENEEENEDGEKEEMIDLDMVLSMVRKRQRAAEKARRANAKKARRIKAGEEMERIEETEEAFEPKEEVEIEMVEEASEEEAPEKVSVEIENEEAMMEVDEEMTGEEKEEPDMVSEENPITDEESEDMEAMKFEPLAALSSLKDIRKEDVDMTLYGEESENPTWNVTVAGIPAARIQLRNQTAADEIRAVFVSDDYAKDLIVHCENTGFIETMKKVNAELWANHTSNARVAAHFSGKARDQFEAERKKLLASYRQNYRSCINIVSAGLSKNFYPQAGNPLKDAMFTNLKTLGMPESSAVSAIEKSFRESAAEYFNTLFDKAEEYMDMSPEARKEIAAAIASGSALDHYVDSSIEDASLADRVAQASVMPQANASLKVSRELSLDAENYKNELKNVWKI